MIKYFEMVREMNVETNVNDLVNKVNEIILKVNNIEAKLQSTLPTNTAMLQFPECAKDCSIVKALGAGECDNVCGDKFRKQQHS